MNCVKCSRESGTIFRNDLNNVGGMCINCATEIVQATPYRNINVRSLSGVDENLRRIIDEAFCPFERIGDPKDWVSKVKDLWIIAERDLMGLKVSHYFPSGNRVVIVAEEFTGRKPALSLVHEFLHAKHMYDFKRLHGKDLRQVENELIFRPPTTSADYPKREFAWMSITEAAVESLAEKTTLISEEAENMFLAWEKLSNFQEFSRLTNRSLIMKFGTCLLVAKLAKSDSLLRLMESHINLFPLIRDGTHKWVEIALQVDCLNTANWEEMMRDFEGLSEKYK